MSFCTITSIITDGPVCEFIEVEVLIDNRGFPGFYIVGLAAREIREAKERVRSAIKNSGFKFPNKKIIVNLSPADLPKRGTHYDLAIALGILKAEEIININAQEKVFIGELSLDGTLKSVSNAFLAGKTCFESQKTLVLPTSNSKKLKLFEKLEFAEGSSLREVVNKLANRQVQQVSPMVINVRSKNIEQLKQIRGQKFAKRALQIAAAGRHHLYLMGPTGVGKTIISCAIQELLPGPNIEELISINSFNSESSELLLCRPFKAVSPNITEKYLLGGPGNIGEIASAHLGILYLDECMEMKGSALESLRIPLESGQITVSSFKGASEFDCRFQLILSSNACPCGNLGEENKTCLCSEAQIAAYRKKVSQAMLDRIDLQVMCTSHSGELTQDADDWDQIISQINLAYEIQKLRYKKELEVKQNGDLDYRTIDKYISLSSESQDFLSEAKEHFKLSMRAIHKVLKVARTIADLAQAEEVKTSHLAEALQYRFKKSEPR